MTATDPEPTAYERNRARAEGLLLLAFETLGIPVGASVDSVEPEEIPALAAIGVGYAQLAAIDAAAERVNRLATLLGDVLAEVRAIVTPKPSGPTQEAKSK